MVVSGDHKAARLHASRHIIRKQSRRLHNDSRYFSPCPAIGSPCTTFCLNNLATSCASAIFCSVPEASGGRCRRLSNLDRASAQAAVRMRASSEMKIMSDLVERWDHCDLGKADFLPWNAIRAERRTCRYAAKAMINVGDVVKQLSQRLIVQHLAL